jgi:hypothetical protein
VRRCVWTYRVSIDVYVGTINEPDKLLRLRRGFLSEEAGANWHSTLLHCVQALWSAYA